MKLISNITALILTSICLTIVIYIVNFYKQTNIIYDFLSSLLLIFIDFCIAEILIKIAKLTKDNLRAKVMVYQIIAFVSILSIVSPWFSLKEPKALLAIFSFLLFSLLFGLFPIIRNKLFDYFNERYK